MPPFSLYLHIPYCQSKCPYCDFNSYAVERWPEARYVAALAEELRHYAAAEPWRHATVDTIFFGGGTPSLFGPASVRAVLAEVRSLWPVAPAAETTIEANPGTVSREKLDGYRTAGVSRISFGVQSFAPHHLRQLGRIHGTAEALAAVPLARAAGFTNVSIDLIFALPDQTLPEWEADLAHACALQPEHLSAYNLTYEEGTAYHHWRARGELHPLPDDIEAEMFARTQALLAAADYAQYEISNYARPGRACRHNLNYWHHGPYLGVGAGAHSFSGYGTTPVGGDGEGSRAVPGGAGANPRGRRWANAKGPEAYMQSVEASGQARVSAETLTEQQARGELLFLGLRCLEGVRADVFRQRFGTTIEVAFPVLAEHARDGLLESTNGRWRLTSRGLALADGVFATFV